MIVYNHSSKQIMITTDWEEDPNGGPAILKTTYSIGPGEGIDLDILELKPEKTLYCKVLNNESL